MGEGAINTRGTESGLEIIAGMVVQVEQDAKNGKKACLWQGVKNKEISTTGVGTWDSGGKKISFGNQIAGRTALGLDGAILRFQIS